jgi:hypothetical protein
MSFLDRFPGTIVPVLLYARHNGRIGIFEILNTGTSLERVLLAQI